MKLALKVWMRLRSRTSKIAKMLSPRSRLRGVGGNGTRVGAVKMVLKERGGIVRIKWKRTRRKGMNVILMMMTRSTIRQSVTPEVKEKGVAGESQAIGRGQRAEILRENPRMRERAGEEGIGIAVDRIL